MKNTFLCHIYILFLFSVLGTACNEKKDIVNLGEKELYFDESLASISAEGDSAFWLGSKTGDIWYIKQQRFQSYSIATDCIYKIVTDSVLPDGRMCWVGIHNSGLQKWELTESHSLLLEKYAISNKDYNYSVYDILLIDDRIYVATSQGIYVKSRNDKGELKLVYPTDRNNETGVGRPFIVNNLCQYGENSLFCSTQEGLIRIDLSDNNVTVSHGGEQICGISVYDDEICLLTPGKLYIEDTEGNIKHEIELKSSPRIYYRLNNIHYLLSETYLLLSEDLKSFIHVPLRRKIPQFCNNVIATDIQNGFTLLVTEHALWDIPVHLSIFNTNGEVIASCADGHTIFYVNASNELYRQSVGESVATKILDIPKSEAVSGLMTDGRYVYYISNKQVLKRLKVNRGYITNQLFSSPKVLYRSPTKITAFYLRQESRGSRIYLGIQDDLVCIDGNGKSVLIDALHNKYITAFYSLPHTDNLYVSTLNDGVYYGPDNQLENIDGTENDRFIRDISVTAGHNPLLMILTNHYLLCKEHNDSVPLKGYNKLLKVNDSLFYALPEYGLEMYVIDDERIKKQGSYYQDIRFNPKASLVLNDVLYLGSDIGVMKLDAFSVDTVGWVDMESSVPNLTMLLAVMAFVSIMLFIVCWEFFRRKNSREKIINIQLDDLQSRLTDLERIAHFIGEDGINEVEELKRLFQSISPDTSDLSVIKHLSEKIMKKNREFVFKLSRKLEMQTLGINRYEAFEGEKLMNASRRALASDNLESISSQVEINDAWLNRIAEYMQKVADYKDKLKDTLILDGVNSEINQDIEDFTNDIRQKELSELSENIQKMDTDFEHIYGAEASEKIGARISVYLEKLQEVERQQDGQEVSRVNKLIASDLKELSYGKKQGDRIILLRKLAIIDDNIKLILLKNRISILIREYCVVVDKIKAEDDRGIVKSSIDEKIQLQTQTVKNEIEKAIKDFYQAISKDDEAFLIRILQSRKLESLTAQALALQIAMPTIKRSYIIGLLDKNKDKNKNGEDSLAPIISRLSSKLKQNKDSLENHVKQYPYSVVSDVLQLVKMNSKE